MMELSPIQGLEGETSHLAPHSLTAVDVEVSHISTRVKAEFPQWDRGSHPGLV